MRMRKGKRHKAKQDLGHAALDRTYHWLLSALLLGRVVPEEALWLGHGYAVRGDQGCREIVDQINSSRARKRERASGKGR